MSRSKHIAEFEVTMLVRNNRLKKRRAELGLNQKDMAKACGVSIEVWGAFERLAKNPVKETRVGDSNSMIREWTRQAKNIANFFCVEPEELWPDVIQQVTNNSVTKEISGEEMAVLAGGSHQMLLPPRSVVEAKELKEAVDQVLDMLSPREADVLRRRFGLDGEDEQDLKEIGERGVSTSTVRPDDPETVVRAKRMLQHRTKRRVTRERVRGIEHKALRALRHPSRSNVLRPFFED